MALDLRGFGESDKPWDGNDYDTWANDTGRLMQALDLHDVTLVGFSMGGAIAAHYMATHHDPRVTRLVLLAAAAPAAAPTPDTRAALDGFIQADLADQAHFAHEFAQLATNTPQSPERLQQLTDIGVQVTLRASVRGLEELRDRDLAQELPRIHLPTLILHGAHDRIVPFAAAQAQQQMIAGSKLVPFDNSGHALMFDEKDRLVDELASFRCRGLGQHLERRSGRGRSVSDGGERHAALQPSETPGRPSELSRGRNRLGTGPASGPGDGSR